MTNGTARVHTGARAGSCSRVVGIHANALLTVSALPTANTTVLIHESVITFRLMTDADVSERFDVYNYSVGLVRRLSFLLPYSGGVFTDVSLMT